MNPLTIIIPSRNMDNLRVSVPAVRKLEPHARVIVVDDGVSWRDVPPEFRGVEVIGGDSPFVFARNVNLGLRAAGEADCVVLNDDAVLETAGGFSIMQAAADTDIRVGIIGAVTNLTGQPLQRRVRNVAIEETAREVPGYGLRAVEHIAFVCVLIPLRTRRKIAELTPEVPQLTEGLLDERYVLYGSDDLDYCMQCERVALCVCVHDACYVNHGSLNSSYRGLPTAAGDIWPNHRLLRQKWGMPVNPLDPEARGAK